MQYTVPIGYISDVSSPYRLEIMPLNKTVCILAKSTKQLREALQPIVEKYGLDLTRVLLRRVRRVFEEVKQDTEMKSGRLQSSGGGPMAFQMLLDSKTHKPQPVW